jgi:putative transposase
VLVLPAKGQFPNNRQIRRVVQREKSRIELILEKTTKKHFEMAHRGLSGRNWEGVAGPGHTWAIDSTVGDIYLRSSINRAWIVGRPIVYVIVDIWSTAVLGFYVCLTGPSWNTAKVSLFSAAADPALVGELWGYVPVLALDPAPTLCYSLLCDRGEYCRRAIAPLPSSCRCR